MLADTIVLDWCNSKALGWIGNQFIYLFYQCFFFKLDSTNSFYFVLNEFLCVSCHSVSCHISQCTRLPRSLGCTRLQGSPGCPNQLGCITGGWVRKIGLRYNLYYTNLITQIHVVYLSNPYPEWLLSRWRTRRTSSGVDGSYTPLVAHSCLTYSGHK